MDAEPRQRSRIACRCRGLADFRLREAVTQQRLGTLSEVARSTGAGVDCETCHPEIEEILAETRGERVDREVRRENRRTCNAETRARLSEWIERVAIPCLAEFDLTLDGFSFDGLAVRLRLGGRPDDGILRLLTQGLHADVCPDLEVEPLVSRG
jgi:bacterioferritin-associated ferredoxin